MLALAEVSRAREEAGSRPAHTRSWDHRSQYLDRIAGLVVEDVSGKLDRCIQFSSPMER